MRLCSVPMQQIARFWLQGNLCEIIEVVHVSGEQPFPQEPYRATGMAGCGTRDAETDTQRYAIKVGTKWLIALESRPEMQGVPTAGSVQHLPGFHRLQHHPQVIVAPERQGDVRVQGLTVQALLAGDRLALLRKLPAERRRGEQLDRDAAAQQRTGVDLIIEQALLPRLGRRKDEHHMVRHPFQDTEQPPDNRTPQPVRLIDNVRPAALAPGTEGHVVLDIAEDLGRDHIRRVILIDEKVAGAHGRDNPSQRRLARAAGTADPDRPRP